MTKVSENPKQEPTTVAQLRDFAASSAKDGFKSAAASYMQYLIVSGYCSESSIRQSFKSACDEILSLVKFDAK